MPDDRRAPLIETVAAPAHRERAEPRWRRLMRRPGTLFAIGVVALHIVMAAFGHLLVPFDPLALIEMPLMQPTSAHPAGTDMLGRDVLSRVVVGGRAALTVALAGIAVATTLGAIIGVTAAYLRGPVDEAVMRVVDALMSIPDIILITMLVLGFGTGLGTLIVVLAIVYMPGIVRVVRARAVVVATQDFVRAAELRGEGLLWITLREIMPNVLSILAVEYAIRSSAALLRISALSFLGLGVRPPTPDWGLMVQEAMGVILTNPLLVLLPALALSSLILAVNFAVDGIAHVYGLSRAET